jgi:sulfate adenylyltransferase subunit 1
VGGVAAYRDNEVVPAGQSVRFSCAASSVGSSITIELENDINVTRGDMIVKSSEPKVEKISIQQCVGWTVKTSSRCKIFCTTQHEPSLAKIDSVKIIATDFGTTGLSISN